MKIDVSALKTKLNTLKSKIIKKKLTLTVGSIVILIAGMLFYKVAGYNMIQNYKEKQLQKQEILASEKVAVDYFKNTFKLDVKFNSKTVDPGTNKDCVEFTGEIKDGEQEYSDKNVKLMINYKTKVIIYAAKPMTEQEKKDFEETQKKQTQTPQPPVEIKENKEDK